jgi:hypothetical protein
MSQNKWNDSLSMLWIILKLLLIEPAREIQTEALANKL